jgi:putative spermidine/putrescine transport system permease protein
MWLYIVVGLIMLFLVLPILIIIPLSFSASRFFVFPPKEFSLEWFYNLFSNSVWIDSILRSLEIALYSMILALIIGVMASLACYRMNFKGKAIFMSIMVSPMMVPLIVVGIALYRFYSDINIVGSTLALVMSHGLLAIPLVFVTVLTSLNNFDRNLELAAQNLGSTPLGVFFKIILPNIYPGVIAGALFAFITSMDEVVVTIFIAGSGNPTLPKVMWEQMRTTIDPTLAATSTLLILFTAIVFIIQSLLGNRKSKEQI